MSDYEHLKNAFLLSLQATCSDLSIDQSARVIHALDAVAAAYDIKTAETALSVPEDEIPEMVRTYIAVKRIEGLAIGTLKIKTYRLRAFCAAVRKPLNLVTASDIRAYLYKYQEKNGVSAASLDGIRVIICSFFRWAACEGYIERDPSVTVRPIKAEKKQRVSLTQLELEYVRKACRTLRDRAMVEMFYSTGCRVSELCALKISDVNFITKEVHLFGKGSKHRTSYLNAKAAVALTDYLKSRSDNCDALFVSERAPARPITSRAVEGAVRDIAARAPEVKKPITPHIFRHTTATQAVSAGMPVQEVQQLLGHSSVATTMIYVDSNQDAIKASHIKAVV